MKQSQGRVEIMAGSGVNAENAVQLAATGIDALHFSVHIKPNAGITLGMGQRSIPDEVKIQSIIDLFQ